MPEWTENQKKAIFHHGHDILVSAAAGSGKTTILVERIIELLKNNENVDNLLVATFTDPAAAEMKERLIKRIKESVTQDELDPAQKQHMQSQIYKVAVSNISTLHAFCLSVIKKYYYVIDLDPSFRLLSDETERTLLEEQAFDNVRNKYYQKDDTDFIDLTENFSNDKSDDGLSDTIYQLYNFAITNAQTDQWLDNLMKSYQVDQSITDSAFYQKKVKPQLLRDLDNIIDETNSLSDIAADDILSQNYVQPLKEGAKVLSNIKESIINGTAFDDIREELAKFKFPRAKAVDKETKMLSDDDSISKSVASQKTDLKKQVDEQLYNSYFVQNESDTIETIKRSQVIVSKLVEVERAFIKEYDHLKNDNHALDFNDLEHLAVKILNSEVDGQKIALDYYQNRFHEIMIDEYQDVNAMQENIIQLLSNENNHLFMVGDIKQSIYGFRQAAPYIFTGKYQRFQKEDDPNELIQLSKNFRSSVGVDDFVNQIFKKILDRNVGDIDYDDSVKLIPGTNFPEEADTRNEIDILTDQKIVDDTQPAENIDLDESKNIDKRVSKIEFVADRIKQLMDDNYQVFDAKKNQFRDLKYSDIAILMRNKNSNTDLISYFSKAEIPVMVTDAQNYFQTTELQIVMSMLKIIDNPRQDVPLVAVLRSPIVGLNEEELAQIRLADRTQDYYAAILAYIKADNTDLATKLASFLERLEGYRDFANKNSLVKLIWKIYQETGILEYVSGMPGGKQRSANLHALYQRANSYEKNNFMGLHKFINFIQRMQDMDRDLSQPNSIETTDDTVKVMTIHASKGLEFPIVILLNIDDNFNNKDYTSDTLYGVHTGIGISVLNQVSRANVRNIQRSLISDQKQVAGVSEEMRLLYVALTRAKQKLVLVGFNKEPTKMLSNWEHVRTNQQGVINEGARINAHSYQNLIGMSIIPDPWTKNNKERDQFSNQKSQMDLNLINLNATEISGSKTKTQQAEEVPTSPIFRDNVDNILDFQYTHQDAVNTTAYQSVSEIKGLFSDPDDDEMARADIINDSGRYFSNQFKKPSFLVETKKVSATDIGSATHLVLQKVPIEQMPTEDIFTDLIKQLVESNVLKKEIAQKIDITSLINFYQSKLGKAIVENSTKVEREFPFSVLMPAEKLFNSTKDSSTSDDKILVHGIIDGVIELEKGIIVFDYKTDNVNSQNLQEKIKTYSGQLNLYAKAISLIKEKPVIEKYLYFLKVNQIEKLD